MAEFQGDQAEGLRRLLERSQLRVMAIVTACRGIGQTSVIINVAVALAARGSRVLIIDENHGPGNVSGLLGVRPRYELQHVMRDTCNLEEALLAGPHGVTLLSAATGRHALPAMRQLEQERLIAGFGRLDGRFDVVLVDTPCDSTGHPGFFTRAVRDTIIVSSTAAQVITSSYALIKHMRAQSGGRRFHVMLNRVICERNAGVVVNNLRTVVQGRLATPLGFLGCVPDDVSMRRAVHGFQPVVVACPAAPAAAGFRRVAAGIAQWPRDPEPRTGLDSLIQRLLTSSRFAFDYAGA